MLLLKLIVSNSWAVSASADLITPRGRACGLQVQYGAPVRSVTYSQQRRIDLRVTNLWDTKFVRLLRSQAAALNDKVRKHFMGTCYNY